MNKSCRRHDIGFHARSRVVRSTDVCVDSLLHVVSE